MSGRGTTTRLEQVSHDLLLDWNPLDVHTVDEGRRYYDDVAAHLIAMIDAGDGVQALADYLVSVETERFGRAARAEQALDVARAVHRWQTWKPVLPVPEAFVYLAQGGFHQDSRRLARDEIAWIGRALRILSADQRRVVRKFLTELLALAPSGQQLQDIWQSTGPDWGFPDDEALRLFLTLVRDMAGE